MHRSYLISKTPFMVSSFIKNLSGLNSIGSSHTFGSQPISATKKLMVAPSGILYPSTSTSFVTLCGSRRWPDGCLLSPSKTTAFRYGIFCRSSSFITDSSSTPGDGGGGGGPTTEMISS
ncbi:hypothetical protein Ccrd_000444 [Cynara cardunculus var. scolymus]|uniref:Uncharacterized protein n=1 Tax=Cynara cardunculus var. scolymus TaxID=59895 RepID=A0A103XV92_CYNCS|nr:hypothetical protein Ccrd_000444 [Cynara cardunculus var. scolymus]